MRRLSLLFGVTAVQSDYGTELRSLLDHCAALAAHHGIAEPGDLIAITAGLDGQELGTNLFEVHRVPEKRAVVVLPVRCRDVRRATERSGSSATAASPS